MVSDRTGEIFERQFDSIHFHVARDDALWMDRYAKPDRPVQMVTDFGCGVQFTPHLMVETLAVCERLGIDTLGVVGPQFCCGQPYRGDGKDASGDAMADHAFERMSRLEPLAMTQWCGAALAQFSKRAAAGAQSAEVVHLTGYLARRVEELGDAVPWQRRIDAKVLVHLKSQDPMPFTDRGPAMRQSDMVPAMLEHIPGVAVVGELRSLPSSLPCEEGMDKRDDAGIASLKKELAAAIQTAGADRLVCVHHQCFREWGKLASDGVPVQHYISVLAEALDVAQPDRYHAYWEQRDPDAAVEQARGEWSSWGLSEDQARTIARRIFGRT